MNLEQKKNLYSIIKNEKWNLLTKFQLDDICSILSFKESMALAYDLFFKNFQNDEVQEFAVHLFFIIKHKYPTEWNQDWKNDAFLGKLCSITWRYNDMYESYKKAYDRLTDPPDSLLLLLASCNSVPGEALISQKEAEDYLHRALKKKITYEAAIMMRAISRDKQIKEEEEFWDQKCIELDKANIHTELIIPDVLLLQNRC